jgi:hypothetical protein
MIDDDVLVRLLMKIELLDPPTLLLARRIQQTVKTPLYFVLLDNRLVDEASTLAVVSHHINTPCVSLSSFQGDADLLRRVPRKMAESFCAVPIGIKDDTDPPSLFLAMADPTDLRAMDTISQATGLDVNPVLVGPHDLRAAIARCYKVPLEELQMMSSELAISSDEASDLGWEGYDLDQESNDYLKELLDGDDDLPVAEEPTIIDTDSLLGAAPYRDPQAAQRLRDESLQGAGAAASPATPSGRPEARSADTRPDFADASPDSARAGEPLAWVRLGAAARGDGLGTPARAPRVEPERRTEELPRGASAPSSQPAEPARRPEPVSEEELRNFMTKSAVAVLDSVRDARSDPPEAKVGSRELLEAVIRVLIQQGVITETDILEQLAEVRRRRIRGERWE